MASYAGSVGTTLAYIHVGTQTLLTLTKGKRVMSTSKRSLRFGLGAIILSSLAMACSEEDALSGSESNLTQEADVIFSPANLDDSHLDADPRVLRHLEAKDKVAVMTKAASFLLWYDDFSQTTDEEVTRRAAQSGVGLVSAQIYYLKESRTGEFVLGYAGLSERKIQEGIRRLTKALR